MSSLAPAPASEFLSGCSSVIARDGNRKARLPLVRVFVSATEIKLRQLELEG